MANHSAHAAHAAHATFDCRTAPEAFRDLLEGNLTVNEVRGVEGHVAACPRCQKALAEYKQMFALMDGTIGAKALDDGFDQGAEARLKRTPKGVALPRGKSARMAAAAPAALAGDYEEEMPEGEEEGEPVAAGGGFLESLSAQFGSAPWWIISGAFHGLLILLVFLIGMVVMQAKQSDVVIVTDLEKQEKPPEPEKKLERDIIEKPIPVVTENEVVTDQQPIVTHEVVEFAEQVETDNDSDAKDSKGEDGISDIWLGGQGTVGSIGVGGGGRAGAFGRPNGAGGRLRRAIAGGGGKPTESAVDKALEWLARHQEADGSWSAWKHEAVKDGRTEGVNGDAAMTGYALLAFLGAGHTSKIGKYKDNVRRGLEWMITTLDQTEKANGRGRYCNNHGSNYTQGVAGLALAEAAAMCRDPRVSDAAQRAIDGVVFGQRKKGQSEYEAWGYAPNAGINDTSVTGWNVMAIKSAKVAGLQVDPASYEGAMRWINAGQELENAPQGDAAYWEGGMMWYQGTAEPKNRHGHKNMALTSAASLTRLLVGGEKPTSAGVAGPANLMQKPENLPTQDVARFNLYYWYYGTLTMFQVGGDHWKAWNEAMKPTLINSQRKDGDFDGSWDPLFSEPQGHIYGGRVMSTALGAMCLEVYYRYLPIYR